MQAVKSGANILTGSDQHFQVEWLRVHIDDVHSSAGRDLLQAQPELVRHLSRALTTYARENALGEMEVNTCLG